MRTRISQLRLVEIELFSFCNRKCPWCPNNYIDRISKCEYLDLDILKSLSKELSESNYKGRFSFSRYNEPFSDLDRLNYGINIIKEYLPSNIMVSNSNGDYIDEHVLKTMLIDELSIMDYDCKGRDFVLDKMKSWHINNIKEYSNYFIGEYDNKKVLYYYSWKESSNISDRGGNLKKYSLEKRDYPCYEPLYFVGVNYDGTVSPCCNIRSDCSNQKDFIFGNLKTSSLSDILNSDKFCNFLNNIINAKYDSNTPCYYCNNKGGRYTKENGGILYE